MVDPYADDEVVKRLTEHIVSRGHIILQSHKLALTDRAHVEALLIYFNPPRRARVLDLGCGIGAVADMMICERPDLKFTLFNVSQAQLDMAPDFMPRVCGDFREPLPFDPASFDAVMFNYSLGHGPLAHCLAEAARVLAPGGVLFLYELASEPPGVMIETYRAHPHDEVICAALDCDFSVSRIIVAPVSNTRDFIDLVGQETFVARGFDRTWPVVYRFSRV